MLSSRCIFFWYRYVEGLTYIVVIKAMEVTLPSCKLILCLNSTLSVLIIILVSLCHFFISVLNNTHIKSVVVSHHLLVLSLGFVVLASSKISLILMYANC